MLKRVLALMFALLLILSLPGCGKKSDLAAAPTPEGGFKEEDIAYSVSQGMELDPETGRDKYLTDPVPEGKPMPVEPQDAEVTDTEYHCILSIDCKTILDNMEQCNKDKRELVPEDGWILEPTEVVFFDGENVFQVLKRTCKQKGIHMEFMDSPIYNSAYIEGINNLYELDVGKLSGWMYSVNGWYPNYGSSRYALKDGDVVEWRYTCDCGDDVGGGYATGGTTETNRQKEDIP